MNDVTELIVGIDVGSSGLTGGIARRNSTGDTELLALERITGNIGVRRGVVHNIEDVSKNIQTLLNKLIVKSGFDCKVASVYVGINGYSTRTINATSSARLSGDERLGDRQLDDLNDEAQSNVPEGLSVYDVFPQEFLLDGKVDTNPVGTMPKLVEAHYKIVVGQPFIFKNLDACFKTLTIKYESILGPIAVAEAILKPDDKAKGVVVVDFGAQTTSVCVIKSSIVRYLSVLPFGGDSITKDLLHLNIETSEAEKLKWETGSAIHLSEKPISEDPMSELDKVSSYEREANEIIVARAEEIVDNIYAQIRYSGIELQKLTEGIVMTGGASHLHDLGELLTRKTGLSVRSGNPGQHIVVNQEEMDITPNDALCMGLLLMGRGNCCTETKIEEILVRPERVVMEPEIEGFDTLIQAQKGKTIKPTKPPKAPKESKGKRFGGLWDKIFEDEDI